MQKKLISVQPKEKLRVSMIAVLMVCSTYALGQDQAEKAATDKNDKTGTNPINFQRDIRFYNEYSWLNTAGDGNQNVSTVEFRTPFADGKWQFRTRARFSSIEADFDNDGTDDLEESGLGDVDFRLLTVPYLKGANAIAVAMEVFLDTASDDALGSGATSLGPQVFYARFFKESPIPYYSGGGFFAPGLQYKFSVEEDGGRDDVDQILIDLNYFVLSKDKQAWFFTDPQIVFDLENDDEYAVVDFEFGFMMTKWFPDMKGQSVWIRPAIGVGHDRPVDGGIELGYKIVGW